jgi:predicted DNA-binding transcriptional regulator YafY
MRGEKLANLIRLALELAGSAEGMTLDEMATFLGATRRTAERQRDAIELACGGALDRVDDGRKVRFRMGAAGIGRFTTAPTAQEMAEIETIALASEAVGDTIRAGTLRSLKRKIQASLRIEARQNLGRDVEAQLRAEAFARQVGPHPYADADSLTALRKALLASKVVTFRYRADPRGSARERRVTPYGLLIGPYYYLVARTDGHAEPALFRLDRIDDVVVTDEPGAPPKDFDLKAYAERSFGVFMEEPEDIVLRFDASAAPAARAYVFHPTQTMTDEADGSLTVRFPRRRAGADRQPPDDLGADGDHRRAGPSAGDHAEEDRGALRAFLRGGGLSGAAPSGGSPAGGSAHPSPRVRFERFQASMAGSRADGAGPARPFDAGFGRCGKSRSRGNDYDHFCRSCGAPFRHDRAGEPMT